MTAASLRRPVSTTWGALAIGYAAAVGFLSARGRSGIALAALPLACILVLNPVWAVVAFTALIPWQRTLPGTAGTGLQVSIVDLIAALAVIGTLPRFLLDEAWRKRLLDVRPILMWMAPFFLWGVVVVLAHPSSKTLANFAQYLELTAITVVLSTALSRRSATAAVTAFLVVSAVTAIVWISGHSSLQAVDKNPAGQFMADGALLGLVAIRRWQIRLPITLLLVVGILYTQSRGAALGAVVGGLVLVGARGLGSWRRTVAILLPAAIVVVVGYNAVPYSLRHRVSSTFNSNDLPASVAASNTPVGTLSPSQYTVQIRGIYRREGIALAKKHPIVGVGFGNYVTGDRVLGTLAGDPHEILILNAAEGGIPDLIFFVLMFVGPAVVLFRRRNLTEWSPVALAVQAAIVTHGLVDIYWVRGTPMIGWLLVGLAMNQQLDRRPDHAETAGGGAPRLELGTA